MAASPGTTAVGFVGLGNIGRPMVQALLNAGWDVAVLDRVPDRADELADAGASVAKSPTDLADCEILVLAVPDDAAVESVLEGPDGWLEQSREGRTVIVHSTVLPETAARLSQVCADRGVGLLDAPVSGGADRAEKGDLTIMIGGDADVVERVRPLLDSEGSQVLIVGWSGHQAGEPADDAVRPGRSPRSARPGGGPWGRGGESA
jgi:3-hydroxyisobutyrate dehydrogenase